MRIYSSLKYRSRLPSVIALGCFDGIHIGHERVIREAVNTAKRLRHRSIVWTFEESPKNFFKKGSAPSITDKFEKRDLISSLGADVLVCLPFDGNVASMEPRIFFETVMRDSLKASHIVCGFNYTFGSHGAGNVELLRELCKQYGIGLTVIDPISVDNVFISSSEIREKIATGEISKANLLLGRPYSINAAVINGQHLARRLGFPTVNQIFPDDKPIPKFGVYVTRVTIGYRKRNYFGITNVGVRPTVGGNTVFVETHILDLSEDLYGKALKTEFLHFIREEQKFDSLEALKQQVLSDIDVAKKIILDHIKQKKS